MDILKQVEEFARQAHGDQQRKYEPGPYYIHLIRVKDLCSEYTKDPNLLSAALLHDVLEDTPVTREEVENFLNNLVGEKNATITTKLVVELTDVYIKKNFPQWNRRKRKAKEAERLGAASPEAQTIKYADIIDNSLSIQNAQDNFGRVYLFEAKAILAAMNKGNRELHARALETVSGLLEAMEK